MTTNDIIEAIKRNRKTNREEEIRLHGHPISFARIVKNKKAYTRKKKHKLLDNF